jgi:NADH dehydrogenase FAD-containing subunit
VDVKLQTKVMGSTQMPNGRQELTLSGGDKLITDMYIPTFGLIPNSSYIPAKFLNANGSVTVDEYLKVKGAGAVWAIGDVSDVEPSQFISCDRQSAYLAKNITFILSNKTPLPYKVATSRMITFLLAETEFWLIFCRYDGSPDWQEGRSRPLRKYEDSKLYNNLGAEDTIHREYGAYG